jgi:hypothetical protein
MKMSNLKGKWIIPVLMLITLLLVSCTDQQASKGFKTFTDVEAPPPPEEIYVPSPKLVSPASGAIMDNGRSDHNDSMIWDFDWSDVPGATQYQLHVTYANVDTFIDTIILSSTYHSDRPGAMVTEQDRNGWTWKVRAEVGGLWSNWSEEWIFNIEPIDVDPPLVPVVSVPPINTPSMPKVSQVTRPDPVFPVASPINAPTTPISGLSQVPALISSAKGALKDNGRTDFKDYIVWDFDWPDVPGASQYQLYVIGPHAIYPAVNSQTAFSSYHYVNVGYIENQNCRGWTWKFRSQVDGQWGEWSEVEAFDIEPVNTDLAQDPSTAPPTSAPPVTSIIPPPEVSRLI